VSPGNQGNADTLAEALRVYSKLRQHDHRPVRLKLFTLLETYLDDRPNRRHVDSAAAGAFLLPQMPEFVAACDPWASEVFGLFLKFRMDKEGAKSKPKPGRGPHNHKLYTRRNLAPCKPERLTDECEMS
jgi:hypothetical protein